MVESFGWDYCHYASVLECMLGIVFVYGLAGQKVKDEPYLYFIS